MPISTPVAGSPAVRFAAITATVGTAIEPTSEIRSLVGVVLPTNWLSLVRRVSTSRSPGVNRQTVAGRVTVTSAPCSGTATRIGATPPGSARSASPVRAESWAYSTTVPATCGVMWTRIVAAPASTVGVVSVLETKVDASDGGFPAPSRLDAVRPTAVFVPSPGMPVTEAGRPPGGFTTVCVPPPSGIAVEPVPCRPA